MNVCKALLFFVLLFIAVSSRSFAQFKTSGTEIGINAGTLVYMGDLSRSSIGDYKSLHPAFGLYASRSLDQYFAVRANFTYGHLSSNELNYSTPVWKQYRAFNFSTPVTELSALLVFNPFGESDARKLTPYFLGGAGVTFLGIRRDWSKYNRTIYDEKSSVATGLGLDTVRSLPKALPVVPVGAGLKYRLSSQLSLNAEAIYRFTFTDYLDGFKYAGNPTRGDSYYGISIGISYRFGGYRCPPVRR